MLSHTIIQAMLDAKYLDDEVHNAVDFINFTVRAAKVLEAALKKCKSPEQVSDVVASMFDNGFCNREREQDPMQWVNFAEAAVAELKGL